VENLCKVEAQAMQDVGNRNAALDTVQPTEIVGKRSVSAEEYIRRLELVLAGTHDAPWLISPKPGCDPSNGGLEVWWSDRICELLGYSKEEIATHPPEWKYDLIHPDDKAIQAERRRQLVSSPSRKPYEVEGRFLAKNGQYRWFNIRGVSIFEKGEFVLSGGSIRDIHDTKTRELELTRAATIDPLTGIPNRSTLLLALEQAVHRLKRRDIPYALVYVDLDRFKHTNDIYGHCTGDFLLQKTAQRLRDALRPDDAVARLHGDEFAAVLRDVRDFGDLEMIAERLSRKVAQPVTFQGRTLQVTASIGIVIGTSRHPFTVARAMAAADSAMYEAKRTGQAWAFFNHHRKPDTIVITRA
jgi:diguanylate cyclase (GGDEF)-like protein/PAS domain S-box-containing protein